MDLTIVTFFPLNHNNHGTIFIATKIPWLNSYSCEKWETTKCLLYSLRVSPPLQIWLDTTRTGPSSVNQTPVCWSWANCGILDPALWLCWVSESLTPRLGSTPLSTWDQIKSFLIRHQAILLTNTIVRSAELWWKTSASSLACERRPAFITIVFPNLIECFTLLYNMYELCKELNHEVWYSHIMIYLNWILAFNFGGDTMVHCLNIRIMFIHIYIKA